VLDLLQNNDLAEWKKRGKQGKLMDSDEEAKWWSVSQALSEG